MAEARIVKIIQIISRTCESLAIMCGDILHSHSQRLHVLLAKAAGVKEEEILASTEDIDSFFLD